MTGEDMIIQEAAKLLREAPRGTHMELRRAFWFAGRCEHCGQPTPDDGERCLSCKHTIVNRRVLDAGVK